MIKIASYQTKEADTIYGEYVEKVAFDVATLIPSLVGAVAGSATSKNIGDKHMAIAINEMKNKGLSNDHYSNISNLLDDLKVVFTPINVIYSVRGQTFDIIGREEMNEEMARAFRKRDGEYYKNLLLNKMNMEMQMAERIFSRRMVENAINKQANFLTVALANMDETGLDKMANYAIQSLERVPDGSNSIKFEVNLDSLKNEGSYASLPFAKVASFKKGSEMITREDFARKIKVGFMPDRVVFMYGDTLIEQMSLTQMNEKGYEAFKNRDKKMFIDFFLSEVDKYTNADNLEKEASFNGVTNRELDANFKIEENEISKVAADLREVVGDATNQEWLETLTSDLPSGNIFVENNVNPIIYDAFLDANIGKDWHENTIESTMKFIEENYIDNQAIPDAVFNKLLLINTIQSEDNTVFLTPFTFEKMVRSFNDMSLEMDAFQGGLEFEQIIFALQVANAISDYNIYVDMTEEIAAYVSEELFNDDIRIVSTAIFDDLDNEFEINFWLTVNGYLMRKWKEKDAKGLFGEESSSTNVITSFIAESVESLLTNNAQLLDLQQPYKSSKLVTEAYFHDTLSKFEGSEGIVMAVTDNLSRHLVCVSLLEIKQQESQKILVSLGMEE